MTRLSPVAATLAALLPLGCANRHDTGEALIAAGTITALAAAEASTRVTCVQNGCAAQTSRRAAQAAAGVAAGVALAAAGAALQNDSSADAVSFTPSPARVPAAGSWRLVRKPDDAEEAPAYYIEE